MIQYFTYHQEIKSVAAFQDGCWVNVIAPITHNEFKLLSQQVGIPADFLSDTMDIDERSRYETDEDITMIIVKTPYENQINPQEEENEPFYITVPTSVILVKNTIVTIDYFSKLSGNKSVLTNIKAKSFSNPNAMLLSILEETTKNFMFYLKHINHKTSLFESKLYNSNKNEELMNLLKIQKSLVYFVTSLRTNETLMMKLSRVSILKLTEDEADHLADIIVDTSQALEMSNIYANILNNTLDSYASIIANNQNEVLRKLSIITLVVTFPTLVASIYGMNVPLPYQHSTLAFYVTISLSIVLSLLIGWLMLKRKVF